MRNILPILLMTTALPFSAWGMNEPHMDENESFQWISQNKQEECKETEEDRRVFGEIFTLAQSDKCEEIKKLLKKNKHLLSDSLKVWSSTYNVKQYDIPKTKYFSLLNEGLKKTQSPYLQAMYYDAIAFCYLNGWEVSKNHDFAVEYWKKGAALGFAESSYCLGKSQIEDEDRKIDLTYFVEDVSKDLSKISTRLSLTDYQNEINALFNRIIDDEDDEEGEGLHSEREKNVSEQVCEAILKIDKNLKNSEYKEKVEEELEKISEIGKYKEIKLNKIIKQAIELEANDMIDEVAKQCMPRYTQAIENIIHAAKLGFPLAIEYIKNNKLTGAVDEYYNSNNDSQATQKLIDQFKKGALKYWVKGSPYEWEQRIQQHRQSRISELCKILNILSKDFNSSNAQAKLVYDVEAFSGILEKYKNWTNYDLCIEAGEFLLGLGVTEKKFKTQESSNEKIEETVDVEHRLAHAYYGKAKDFARKGDEKAEEYALKAVELGNKDGLSFLRELAECYVKGRKYDKESTKSFQQIPQKAFDLYLKLIEFDSEKSKDALVGVEKCIDFIINQTNAQQYVYEDDIQVLTKKREIINSKLKKDDLSSLNKKFKQLKSWARFNTGCKLTLSENKEQDLNKSQTFLQKFINGPKLSKSHTEKASRLLEVIKGRKDEYKKLLTGVVKDFNVTPTLDMSKFDLSVQMIGALIRKINYHSMYGNPKWDKDEGDSRKSTFVINPENKGEIDLLFEFLHEKDEKRQEKGLMTEETAIEARKMLFPRDEDDLDESDSDD